MQPMHEPNTHDAVIKWKHFPRYWPFVRIIHRSAVDSPHKCQWCGALMFSLIFAWTNGWTNNQDAGDLRRHSAHHDVNVMLCVCVNGRHCEQWTYLTATGNMSKQNVVFCVHTFSQDLSENKTKRGCNTKIIQKSNSLHIKHYKVKSLCQ